MVITHWRIAGSDIAHSRCDAKSYSHTRSGTSEPLRQRDRLDCLAPRTIPGPVDCADLGAATYPDQIAAASNWLNSNQGLQGEALLQAADKQPWDPSVKALTQFPTVLDQMAKNLAWTSALGDAAFNQQKDVMASIQRLRQQAKAAGNLKSGQQIQVVQQDPQTIVIQPTNPQVVYVPQYNPTVVYGTPYSPPGYSTGAMVATGLLSFGVGMAVGAAINNHNSCCGWGYGYGGWGCNWHGGNVTYQPQCLRFAQQHFLRIEPPAIPQQLLRWQSAHALQRQQSFQGWEQPLQQQPKHEHQRKQRQHQHRQSQ